MPTVLPKFVNRALRLLQELRYAVASGATLRDAAALVRGTLRFHLYNHWKLHGGLTAKPFSCRVNLGNRAVPLTLRPISGDLFVLYEVLRDEVYRIPSSVLPQNDVRLVVDCGANIGLTSLYLADRYPQALVIAVEPHPDNFELLVRNTAVEPRIKPVHACVAGAADHERFISVDRPSWGNRTNRDGVGVPVACLTIQDLTRDSMSQTIDLLKIDIEGAEQELFSHPEFLHQTRFVIIELHGDYGVRELRRDIEPMGFEVFEPAGDLHMVTARQRAAAVVP